MPQYSGSSNGRLLEGNNADGHVQLFDHDDGVTVRQSKSKCSTPIKILVVIVIILLLLCAAFLTAIVLLGLRKSPDICMTSHCIKTAASLLAAINKEVNPCDDFYEFACGNWIKTHPIPDDRATVSNFEEPTIAVTYALKKILEDKSVSSHSSVEKAKGLYQSCENDTLVEQFWRSALDEFLQRMGGWPVLNRNWKPSPSIKLSKLYGFMTLNYSQESLFKFTVGADDKNSSINIFQIDQAQLALQAREFYLVPEGQDDREAYVELMTDTVTLLGADPASARQQMAEVMLFETQLANITREENRHDVDTTYHKRTLSSLRSLVPKFDWIDFLGAVYPGRVWSPFTEVVVYCNDFLEDLNRLLDGHNEIVVTNYLMWRWFFANVLPQLSDPYFMVHFKFNRALQIMKVPELRWKGCVRQTNTLMYHATGAMYVQRFVNPSVKQRASEMIKLLKKAFHELLDENDWLTPETRLVASEKVEAMLLKIGYPDFITNLTLVDNYYKDYEIFEGDFYRSKFAVEYMNNRAQFNKISETMDKTKWTTGSAVVNAFYSPNTNEIMFPVGILQPVFYNEHYPWSMNFGGIGVVIGHEITHGFDDKGRQYDKDGNIREWWDNTTIQKFEEKARCIEDQYSSYTLKLESTNSTMHINGKLTKGENIADNGGLKQAFRAYSKWAANHPTEGKLPGLDYTHSQLFFLNYAQIWCGAMNDKEAVRKIKTSVHSPGMIRVRGPLSNSLDFAKAFDCPVGSNMNPEPKLKCKVW